MWSLSLSYNQNGHVICAAGEYSCVSSCITRSGPPKIHFTHSSVYILTVVSGGLCATLYICMSYIRLPGLLKYKALLFLQILVINYLKLCTMYSGVGWDSSVGIATRYGLDGPEIESRWGARFSAPVRTGPGAHPASCTMGTGSFPGVKRPERGVDHPPSSSAAVKERV